MLISRVQTEVLEPLTGLIEELVIDLGKELDSYKRFKENGEKVIMNFRD